MKSPRTLLIALLVLLVSAAGLPVTLTGIAADPVAWRGKSVEFTLQYEAPLESWNPWLTRFSEDKYTGFSAWGDELQLWKAADFEQTQVRLFAAKGSAAARALEGAPAYRRFAVTAVARSVFNGHVWIEITSAKALPRSIGAGALVHAGRAIELAEKGHKAAAVEQYERALAAPLPTHMRKALEAERDRL